jgi:hydrogenase maturation protein HypF
VSLPGGDVAIRQPWRIALGLLRDANGDAAPVHELSLFDRIPAADLSGVARMLEARLNTPLARGVGRYFDAFGALVLARPHARYEGQVAFELNMAADRAETGSYGYEVEPVSGLTEVDLRPALREAVADLLNGIHAPAVSARFHNTLVRATSAVVETVARDHGMWPRPTVVLTGGCFQNALLAEGVSAQLRDRCDVRLHRHVPPGDGGIALGQALVAALSTGR